MKPFHLEVSRSLLSHFGKRQAFLVLWLSHLFIWLAEGTEIEKTGGCLVNDRLGCSGMENSTQPWHVGTSPGQKGELPTTEARPEEQPTAMQILPSVVPRGGCQQVKAQLQLLPSPDLPPGSCSFSSVCLLPSPRLRVAAVLPLTRLPEPVPPAPLQPLAVPPPQHKHIPHFSGCSLTNMCLSLPHVCPLTSSLLLPAQGLPSGPHQPLLTRLLLLLLELEFSTLQPSVPPSPSLWLSTAMCKSRRCTKELQEHCLEAQRQNRRRDLSPIFQGDLEHLDIWDFLRESCPINMSKLATFANTSPITVQGRRICCQSVFSSFSLGITKPSTRPAGNLAAIPSPLLIS